MYISKYFKVASYFYIGEYLYSYVVQHRNYSILGHSRICNFLESIIALLKRRPIPKWAAH